MEFGRRDNVQSGGSSDGAAITLSNFLEELLERGYNFPVYSSAMQCNACGPELPASLLYSSLLLLYCRCDCFCASHVCGPFVFRHIGLNPLSHGVYRNTRTPLELLLEGFLRRESAPRPVSVCLTCQIRAKVLKICSPSVRE